MWLVAYTCRNRHEGIIRKIRVTNCPPLIGYGLYIGHHCGTIVSPHAIIGNNVNLSHFTTIGEVRGKAAVIGDNTYIGPSVCIVGQVNIGKKCTIGAGAVVTHDIPSGSTAAGVPAKVISTKEQSGYIGYLYPIPENI